WINLPAAEKMKPPAYRDIAPDAIPVAEIEGGGRVKIIAGSIRSEGRDVRGPVVGGTTQPLYLDVHLPAHGRFVHALDPALNSFVYVYQGCLLAGAEAGGAALPAHSGGVLEGGDTIELAAGAEGARALLLAGR